jgi:hypothetical protein
MGKVSEIQIKLKIFLSLIIWCIAMLASSCDYDKRETVEAMMTCDVTAITLTSAVRPILSANCIQCHSGSAPAGGLDFERYSDIRTVAANGKLTGSINHRPGFQPMPQFASKLPDCEIMKIEKWVNDGAQNN